MKKFCHIMMQIFYYIHFFLCLHILATRGQKVTFFAFLATILPNLNKIKSDLHQTFRSGSWWSSKVIQTNRCMQNWARGPQWCAWRTTTDLLNRTEFDCSEENQSCSGGYPDLIFSVGGCTCLHVCTPIIQSHIPCRARIFGHYMPKNSSILK